MTIQLILFLLSFENILSLAKNNDRLDPVMQIIAFEIEENDLDKN
ncbi:7046_t:CDS:2 [Funneliformis mosseae]|uniref:7046_t:CDS:1 n=1 Tax=Funneliformis mosseae TaxID=27381 RepID=A0A9N9FWC2_FUNMO|nr:7046_t:CDS:2 [Funneliformis mosseae]